MVTNCTTRPLIQTVSLGCMCLDHKTFRQEGNGKTFLIMHLVKGVKKIFKTNLNKHDLKRKSIKDNFVKRNFGSVDTNVRLKHIKYTNTSR